MSRDRVIQRTWERGVGGETFACGTGACAVCVVGVLTGRTSERLQVPRFAVLCWMCCVRRGAVLRAIARSLFGLNSCLRFCGCRLQVQVKGGELQIAFEPSKTVRQQAVCAVYMCGLLPFFTTH